MAWSCCKAFNSAHNDGCWWPTMLANGVIPAFTDVVSTFPACERRLVLRPLRRWEEWRRPAHAAADHVCQASDVGRIIDCFWCTPPKTTDAALDLMHGSVYLYVPLIPEYTKWNAWKCIAFKCVRKPTQSRLWHTMQTNPTVEQNRNIKLSVDTCHTALANCSCSYCTFIYIHTYIHPIHRLTSDYNFRL